jgi:hypothetical protein
MPISLSTSVRRALGLGAAAVAAAIAIWILSDNINKKKKKKEIKFPDIIEEQQQFVQVSEEMEVLVSAAVEELHTSPKEEMEALIEVLEIDEEKAPVSRSWTDLVEEELEADANQLEQSLSSQLPKSQPQIVVSLFSYFYLIIFYLRIFRLKQCCKIALKLEIFSSSSSIVNYIRLNGPL